MESTADVVIIGGGIVGSSVGFHLAEAGCTDVLILERDAQQGLGSTGKATGGVRAQFATAINIQMSRYSIEFFSHFEEVMGNASGYVPAGYLFVATNESHLAEIRANHARQLAEGLTNVELLSAADVARMVPQLRTDDVVGGSFCQTDGLISPLEVMRGFTKRAMERGVRVWLNAQVMGIEVEGGCIARVLTTQGPISTRIVVNATGAWAGEVARLAGVEIPVVPLRRQLVATEPFAGLAEQTPMVVDMSNGFHFRRDAQAGATPGVLMAWPDPSETIGFKTEFDSSFIEKIRPHALNRVPCLAQAKMDARRCRAGLYEVTPDHHAIIGESKDVRGFFFANGFSGHGVMHSPATGRIVADLIMEGQTQLFDVAPLGAERFAQGCLHTETSVL